MSDLEHYFDLVQQHPDMFVNPPSGAITILLDRDEIREVESEMAQKLVAAKQPAAWAQVGVAFQDQYVLMLRDAVRFADGTSGTYIRFIRSVPGVIVLPVYQGKVLLIRHFRHATRSWHLELPRGFGERGFSDEENARRELQEEIGATASRLVSLGVSYPDSGASTECNAFFYAEVLSYGSPDIHEGVTAIIPVTVAEFEDLIRTGAITDGFSIVAFARARLQNLL